MFDGHCGEVIVSPNLNIFFSFFAKILIKYFILKIWKLMNWQGQLAWVDKLRIESGHIGLFMYEDSVTISNYF